MMASPRRPSSPPPSARSNRSPTMPTPKAAPATAALKWRRCRRPGATPRKAMAETGDVGDFQAQLDALRADGAADRDPVRFAYLEALIRRATGQPEAIRRMLETKISAAASELAGTQPAAPSVAAELDTTSPLTELLAYIGGHAHAPAAMLQPTSENA